MHRARLMTLNLFGLHGPWPARQALLRAELLREPPDVLALQEVVGLAPGQTQVADLCAELGYAAAFAPACVTADGRDFGNAVLSRHPIVEQRPLPLPNPLQIEPRVALYALCHLPAGLLPVFCAHLDWQLDLSAARCRQLRHLTEEIAAIARDLRDRHGRDAVLPPVLLGDLNAEPDSDEIRYLRGWHALPDDAGQIAPRGVYFQDSFAVAGTGPAATFSRDNPYAAREREPDRRLDYIFVAGRDHLLRGEVLGARRCLDGMVDSAQRSGAPFIDGVCASDHYGVRADIYVAPRQRSSL